MVQISSDWKERLYVLTFGLILSRMKSEDLYIHWFCSASAERALVPLEVLSIERPAQGQTLAM